MNTNEENNSNPNTYKKDLLTLWNEKDWENSNAGIYFTSKYFEKEVQVDKKLIYETY